MILNGLITEGNPEDTDLTIPLIDLQQEIDSRYALKVSFEAVFASKDNLKRDKVCQL